MYDNEKDREIAHLCRELDDLRREIQRERDEESRQRWDKREEEKRAAKQEAEERMRTASDWPEAFWKQRSLLGFEAAQESRFNATLKPDEIAENWFEVQVKVNDLAAEIYGAEEQKVHDLIQRIRADAEARINAIMADVHRKVIEAIEAKYTTDHTVDLAECLRANDPERYLNW